MNLRGRVEKLQQQAGPEPTGPPARIYMPVRRAPPGEPQSAYGPDVGVYPVNGGKTLMIFYDVDRPELLPPEYRP